MIAYVSCYGCEQRELDTQRIFEYLSANNIDTTDNPGLADHLFLVTCGVDKTSQERSIEEIRRVHGLMSPRAKLIIGGCLPSISPDSISQFNVHHTFSPQTLDSLDDILGYDISIRKITEPNRTIYDQKDARNPDINDARERFEQAKNGYKVVIANGCLGTCSYCMIKEATGSLKSKPREEVLHQIEKGISGGEKTIILMAGDTGAYGRDIHTNLLQLLEQVKDLSLDFKLYIHDLGINWLIKDLFSYQTFFESVERKKLIGAITVPLQSGSDHVLSLMNRYYTREDAIRSLKVIRRFSFDIGSHVMIGFPGETDQDFLQTVDLLNEVDLDFITCFPYSEHPNARSAKLEDKVPRQIVEDRIKLLMSTFREKIKVIY